MVELISTTLLFSLIYNNASVYRMVYGLKEKCFWKVDFVTFQLASHRQQNNIFCPFLCLSEGVTQQQ